MADKQLHLIIRGRVQGVFYRKSAYEKALSLDIKGFVRNLPDESVELVAQGEEEKLTALLNWCQIGPPMADVKKINSTWTNDLQDFQTFQIL